MKHLRTLGYVDAVARVRSIRKAAEHLNVTASAVDRRIADLEEELDARLFERQPRGARLTASSEVFVTYLRKQGGRRTHEIADRGPEGPAAQHRDRQRSAECRAA